MLIDSLLTERHQLLAEMSLWRASAGIETCVFPAPVSDAGHGADITRGSVAATEATGVTGSLGSLDLLGRENDVAALDAFAVSDITSMLDVRTAWSGTLSLENDALIPVTWQAPVTRNLPVNKGYRNLWPMNHDAGGQRKVKYGIGYTIIGPKLLNLQIESSYSKPCIAALVTLSTRA
ncbi:hypothetical protein NOR_05294 [Metarhizium rileyi]|uniref:Uncharacterized protein n=1 Tax=Metarhizium rileyi (strain RCEF 4871) TaxID=1649241 RepID=A0A167D066_METRR|nr:hypothetical protein NOR_05294 [Metarhizium rileyi RCEF 4871]